MPSGLSFFGGGKLSFFTKNHTSYRGASAICFGGRIFLDQRIIGKEMSYWPYVGMKLRCNKDVSHHSKCKVTFHSTDMGVSKNRGKTPKMDGENNGKPY